MLSKPHSFLLLEDTPTRVSIVAYRSCRGFLSYPLPMPIRYRVRSSAFREFLRPWSFAPDFVQGRIPTASADDMAEFADVLLALIDHDGELFASREELEKALFGGFGGGMGIPGQLRELVFNEFVMIEHH